MGRVFWAVIATTLLVSPVMAGELAPGGTLRATFLAANPVQARADPVTGVVTGPAADLGQELARQLGVKFQITPVQGVQPVIDSVRSGAADIGFLAFDPTRAVDVDFSQTYSIAWNSYLLPEGSAIRTVADADRPGLRIGVGRGDAADLYLTRSLKSAELKRNALGSMEEAVRMLSAGEVDAYGANRQRLGEVVAQRPGFRLLSDNFLGVEQAIVVTKGDVEKLARVNRFIDEARASGLIRAALDRAKLNGMDVAPPRANR